MPAYFYLELDTTEVAPPAFELELDTTAPTITWGAIAGNIAGELLRVAYLVDEPEILSATLRLPYGRELPVTVTADAFEVLLPPDTATGRAQLRVQVRDDVDNEAERTLDLRVTGAVTGPSGPRAAPAGTGAAPKRAPRRTPGDRIVTEPTSRATWVGRTRTVARREDRTHVGISTVDVVRRSRPPATTRQRTRTRAAVVRDTPAIATIGVARARDDVVRRRDGRGIEEALLLDLL